MSATEILENVFNLLTLMHLILLVLLVMFIITELKMIGGGLLNMALLHLQ